MFFAARHIALPIDKDVLAARLRHSANLPALAQRLKNTLFAYISIDNLECINRTHGVCMGNRCVFHVLHSISSCIRSIDYMGHIDAGEVLVVFPDCSRAEADHIVERAHIHLRQKTLFADNTTLTFDASIHHGHDFLQNGVFQIDKLVQRGRTESATRIRMKNGQRRA